MYSKLLLVSVIFLWYLTGISGDAKTGNEICLRGEKVFDGHCIYESTVEMDFNEARVYCEVMGGSMISIHSQNETQQLVNSFSSLRYWLGGKKTGSGPTDFLWIDQTASEFSEDYGFSKCVSFNDCCLYLRSDDRNWGEITCSHKFRVLCIQPNALNVINSRIENLTISYTSASEGMIRMAEKLVYLQQYLNKLNNRLNYFNFALKRNSSQSFDSPTVDAYNEMDSKAFDPLPDQNKLQQYQHDLDSLRRVTTAHFSLLLLFLSLTAAVVGYLWFRAFKVRYSMTNQINAISCDEINM